MTKLYLDEIDAVLGGSSFSTLRQDSTDAKSADDIISGFCSRSTGKLSGEQWDKVRGKLGAYQTALNTRFSVAGKLADAIEQALKLLKDYMGSDNMLDTSKLEEYREQRSICQESLSTLQSMLNEKVERKVTNSDGTTSTQYVNAYNADAINAQIQLAEETLKELDRIIEKIEGLDEVYKQAEEMMESAYQEVVSFGSSISSIKPSGKYVYKKANG